MGKVEERELTVDGTVHRVKVGGQGAAVVLIHGGWGGAEMHWGKVWDRLAERFLVIAPDLPGVGRTDLPGLGSVAVYARWVVALLDALGVDSAWCVGNSFGASVACAVASQHPDRCWGLVLVNGIPIPPTPELLARLGALPRARGLLRSVIRWNAYSPRAIRQAFKHQDRVPPSLREMVNGKAFPPQAEAMVDVFLSGGPGTPRGFSPLLLWGQDDRLMGTSASSARKLQGTFPASRLVFIHDAGHLPQVEQPEPFADALIDHLTAWTSARTRGVTASAHPVNE